MTSSWDTLSRSHPCRNLSESLRRSGGRSFGRAAALRAEGDGCVGTGQGCGETAGGNLVAGPEAAGRGTALDPFHFKIAVAQGSAGAC